MNINYPHEFVIILLLCTNVIIAIQRI